MADYKTLHGTNIDTVSSDPDNPVKGQVWYNSTSKTLKGRILSAAAWSSGGNLNTGRSLMGSAGIQTAALAVGGDSNSPPPPGRDLAVVESYNGSSWTEVGDLTVARFQAPSSATHASGLFFGGGGQPETPTSGVHTTTEAWTGDSVTAATVTSS